ncbi:hypothetical protein [Cuniculiplasma divulgatum]|uniref:Multipass membrane protein n=1 Tax=Cuniculiplasma divulgatum TaxID=1673428 RepID=A0A1N5S2X0_9ARCH|nr:hypothetical protein [Cuniculiplasma divulgatum]SIM30319.1 multipass membrane protein [Cuniculiplasma divulgatum]
MELDEKAGLICVIWELFLIFSAIFMPSVWHAFLWLLASGNIFLEIIGVIGIAIALIGFLIILYYVISYIVLALVILFTFGAPALALYYFLGLDHSIILALVIAVAIILYLVETRAVRVEHHTVTVGLNRRYVIKR